MSISLAVDKLQAVEYHQAHSEYSMDGPRVLSAFEELVQVGSKPVDDNEPQPDLVKGQGATGLEDGHRYSSQLPIPRPPIHPVGLKPQPESFKFKLIRAKY